MKGNPRRSDVEKWKGRAFKKGRVVQPRVGKRVAYLAIRKRRIHNGGIQFFKVVIKVIEYTIAPDGQMMLFPDAEF